MANELASLSPGYYQLGRSGPIPYYPYEPVCEKSSFLDSLSRTIFASSYSALHPERAVANWLIPSGYQPKPVVTLLNYLHSTIGPSRPDVKPMPKPYETVVCFGAGIDSYIAVHRAVASGKRTAVVWVDYGQPYAAQEYHVTRQLLSPSAPTGALFSSNPPAVFMVKLPPLYDKKANLSWENYIVPCRNAFLASIAAKFSSDIQVIANFRADWSTGAKDKTPQFYAQMSATLTDFYGTPQRVWSPFLNMSKYQAVMNFLSYALGGSVEALKHTFSCYNPGKLKFAPSRTYLLHCGVCLACFKRYRLFEKLNVEYDFAKHPDQGPHYQDFIAHERAKGRAV